jgi:RimJ/RimL family protein N-acetyltransferase
MPRYFPPSGEIPVIETERLRLRPHRLDDFADCAAMWSDPQVVRYIGNPVTREEAWARLLRYIGHWALLGFGLWAVEERESGAYVGDVGFANFQRQIEPALPDVPEAGWVLAARTHGKGYATEAVRVALTWGETRFGGSRTMCLIHPENAASIRVAEKCGYREFHRTVYKQQPAILFERG